MFYEKKDIQEQVTLLSESTHNYYLITSAFDNYKELTRNEFIILTIKWKKKVKEIIHMNDVGYVINGGNILAVVDKTRASDLLKQIPEISFTKSNKSSIYTDVLELNREEIKAVLA